MKIKTYELYIAGIKTMTNGFYHETKEDLICNMCKRKVKHLMALRFNGSVGTYCFTCLPLSKEMKESTGDYIDTCLITETRRCKKECKKKKKARKLLRRN